MKLETEKSIFLQKIAVDPFSRQTIKLETGRPRNNADDNKVGNCDSRPNSDHSLIALLAMLGRAGQQFQRAGPQAFERGFDQMAIDDLVLTLVVMTDPRKLKAPDNPKEHYRHAHNRRAFASAIEKTKSTLKRAKSVEPIF